MSDTVRRRVTTYLVPALIVAVGALQIWRAHTGPLTTARGGGFGMFASNDHGLIRFLRVFGEDASGARVLTCGERIVPEDARRLLDEARWNSSRPRLEAVARAVRAGLRERAAAGAGSAAPAPGGPAAGDGTCVPSGALDRVAGVRVEMWTVEFDPIGNRVRTLPVASAFVGDAP